MYNQIVKAHYAAILFYCCTHLGGDTYAAEDCTQEVFLLLHRKLDTLDDVNIRGWLYAAADRVILSYKRHNPVMEDISTLPEQAQEPELPMEDDLLSVLDSKEQRLIEDYYSGEDRQQVAARYGLTRNALYLRIARIREKLRQQRGKG